VSKEEDIRQQIATLEEELAEEIANRTKVKDLTDFTNEEKVKAFDKIYQASADVAVEQFEAKNTIAAGNVYLYYSCIMTYVFGDIVKRIEDHKNSEDS